MLMLLLQCLQLWVKLGLLVEYLDLEDLMPNPKSGTVTMDIGKAVH